MDVSNLIDLNSLDFTDDQTWLYVSPSDSGKHIDVKAWLSFELNNLKFGNKNIENIQNGLNSDASSKEISTPDKHKFDSRTFVKPKKQLTRPSLNNIVEASPRPPLTTNKFLTYNKYNGPVLSSANPILRLKTFNLDTNSESCDAVKDYSSKRRVTADDDPQLEDSEDATRNCQSGPQPENAVSKPINIDLSQPVHNLHHTFNKGVTNMMAEHNMMYRSGDSLMRMSPPSLVSSLLESSGNFNQDSISSKKSLPYQKDSGLPTSCRESIDPMLTSMTLSILDEKDMNSSFLSQTTNNDNMLGSLPPSLVGSVNSSFIVSRNRNDSVDSNTFSSATYMNCDTSEKLLSSRPRCQLYNNIVKKESIIRNSESYTKSKEESCQIDSNKTKDNCLNKQKISPMTETVTLHYTNTKYKKESEKENLNCSFETSEAFYKDMGLLDKSEEAMNILDVTMDNRELNEIKEARQKLSMARKTLPHGAQTDVQTIHLPNQVITVPKQSMENASELLSKKRLVNSFERKEDLNRETPKRNATFKKLSPRAQSLDTTMIIIKSDEKQTIDINSATMNLIDCNDKTLQQQRQDWSVQDRAMVASSDSADTPTFSSSSPPELAYDHAPNHASNTVSSTPLVSAMKSSRSNLLRIHNTISPIYDLASDQSYTIKNVSTDDQFDVTKNRSPIPINSATLVKSSPRRDTAKLSPEKKIPVFALPSVSHNAMPPPSNLPRKSNLPTSKLRQYSSHRELNRISVAPNPSASRAAPRPMARRGVYASNPILSPTAPAPAPRTAVVRRDSYTLAVDQDVDEETVDPAPKPALVRQGTETLRKERPQSQLVQPKDVPTSRPYSVSSANQIRVSRPSSVPVQKLTAVSAGANNQERPGSAATRPTRLPAPRRALRPPSVYSTIPTGDAYR